MEYLVQITLVIGRIMTEFERIHEHKYFSKC
jgi:hypothetical protein